MSHAEHDRTRDDGLVDKTAEGQRMAGALAEWRRWGPYLSERQWGTVREDYSAEGNSWKYFPHDDARSRAFRWGEDGIAGYCDDHQRLCLSVAFWNGRDPILKERLFGLTNTEGNHGEDVKELYYYLDGVPSHAYMRMLYKYPHAAFPYDELIRVNAARSRNEREYELIDTKVFEHDRYFDIEIEQAKIDPGAVIMRITCTNRGPDDARLFVVPQLFARNTWSWFPGVCKPRLYKVDDSTVGVEHPDMQAMALRFEEAPTLLFCDNETNRRRYGEPQCHGYFKDAIGDWVVHGNEYAVNPSLEGTKVGAVFKIDLAPGASASICVFLGPRSSTCPDGSWDRIVATRRAEADAYHEALQPGLSPERRLVLRQAIAGLLWSKQYYEFDVRLWLEGDALQPAPPSKRRTGRDKDWQHLSNATVMAMPDTWEYPWYACWDLAIHCVTYASFDLTFAKEQLELLTSTRYMHPSGQLPAYEGGFGDANPPLHAWAALEIYDVERRLTGAGDAALLERMFHKLMLNFMWWVNRQDGEGRNIFQGGFLGLDNIGPFNRNKALAGGGTIDECDGTAWVAAYALDLMQMALELTRRNAGYQELAAKFFEHFIYIAEAMRTFDGEGGIGLWDEKDGFYYDVLCLPNEPNTEVKLRSMVGLIPLLAVGVVNHSTLASHPVFRDELDGFFGRRPDLSTLISHAGAVGSPEERSLLALVQKQKLIRILERLFDEDEFLSPHGVRALSKVYGRDPAVIKAGGQAVNVAYAPAESTTDDFGGNSNWRGPVWFPVNLLLVRALQRHHAFYQDDLKVEFPTGSGQMMNLGQIAALLGERLVSLFLRNAQGRMPFLGDDAKQQHDPHFRDLLLFHEYFDGDTGRGCGASHQTGWTASVALLLQPGAP